MSTKCPQCGANDGTQSIQGVLGDQAQLKCRYCGWWWPVPVAEIPFEPEMECDDDE